MAMHGKARQHKARILNHTTGKAWHGVAGRGQSGRGNARQLKTRNLQMRFEKSADTKVIESVLAEANIGDVVTYEQISKAIGRDVREFALSALGSARRGVFKEKKYVFEVIDNVGLKRLNDQEIVSSSARDIRKLRKTARRGIAKLAIVNFDELPEEKKREHTTAAAQMGVIEHFATSGATRRIEKAVDSTKRVIPIGETLKMFGGG